MEETKLNDNPILLREHDDSEVAQWQFQSDPDPYKESDSVQWTWQNYLDDENLIIEEAYLLKQEAANLKDFQIDLQKMVQVNKQDKDKIRRIRRQGGSSRFLMKMSEAKIVTRDQKTMNEAFGTVQHFLEYIMKRTPEAYSLYQRLTTLSLDCKRVEFEDLVQQVAVCIEKGAEVRAKIIKTRTGSKVRNFTSEARQIKDEIEKNSSTLKDFLRTILKAYTMETFVCYWLNELLRSENWEEINILTPYLVCLVYTFKLSDYLLKSQNSEKVINDKFGFVVKHRLYLYRGAALTEDQLIGYNPNKTKYFSWNAVTSTSRDRNVARNFISLNNVTNIGAMFLIEIDFDSLEDYQGMVDVSKYSRYPREQEMILAPGTVFKLLEISLVENGIYEIHLKVTKNIEEAKEDVAFLGVLQEQAILKDKATIDGLPSQQGFKMLDLLRGNKMIRKIEITDSGIEQHIMEEIESVRRTTNVRKEDLQLVDNRIVASGLETLAHYYSLDNLSDILMLNKVRFRSETVRNSPQISQEFQIENLVLKDKTIETFRSNNQLKELWKGLKDESRILGISLSIQKLQIQENELRDFFDCFKEWKSLEGLSLALNETQTISTESFDSLCQVISSSTNFNMLSLGLPISDERLNLLGNTFISLPSLQKLSLQFEGCHEISDEGLSSLADIITSLSSLEHLHFCFKRCNKISNEGFNSLQNGLICLKALHNLSWEFLNCEQISMAGLVCLMDLEMSSTSEEHLSDDAQSESQVSDGAQSANQTVNEKDEMDREDLLNEVRKLIKHPLRHIFLDLRFCKQIAGQSLQNSQRSLTSLSLESDFLPRFDKSSECDTITFLGTAFLKNALSSLKSLQHLSLNFGSCWQISNQGFRNLISPLADLTSLQHLSLNFEDCSDVSDDGLNDLKSALASLTSLQHLSLHLRGCEYISDAGINHINSVLLSLKSLQHLSLNFGASSKASDVALNDLKSALTSLVSLQHLSLDFGRNREISDLGLDYLKNALTLLTSLQHLSLDFRDCKKISDVGLQSINSGLLSSTSLQHLSLNFEYCSEILNDGLNSLSCALTSLTSLKHLFLDFGHCKEISDVGLQYLNNGLVSLKSLQYLSLNFQNCGMISFAKPSSSSPLFPSVSKSISSLQDSNADLEDNKKISDQSLNHLKSGLTSLASLQHLSLNFGECSDLSDDGLNHLKSALTSLTSLQHLSLDFRGCKKISDVGLQYLSHGLVSLISLQHLSLNFQRCGMILDENPASSNRFRSLSSLEDFTIDLRGRRKISDAELNDRDGTSKPSSPCKQQLPVGLSDVGLNYLSCAFVSLKSLQYLSLDFGDWKNVSDAGVNYLSNGLVSLTYLQHLSLNFSDCDQVSDDGLNSLHRGLEPLLSLQDLYLAFERCSRISSERIERLKIELKSIRSLTINWK